MIRGFKGIGYLGILPLLFWSFIPINAQESDFLKYSLTVKPGDVTIDRMPPTNAKSYKEEFLFTVTNPTKTDFKGSAPNCQKFDVEVFFVGIDKEMSVWKWSSGHVFCQHSTPVPISAGKSWTEKAVWTFTADKVKDGKYHAVATFTPTGSKKAAANFTITSVQ